MVGGSSFNARPFNLATNGHRQPGSSFKPFILLRALRRDRPEQRVGLQPKQLPFQGKKGPELFKVSNYEDSYLGSASLWSATAASDNSVFAELGMKVKPRRVARLANRMGIRTELSTNPAMLLGGLEQGVTPLEMAYAYSTIANDGVRVSGSLAPERDRAGGHHRAWRGGLHRREPAARGAGLPAEVGQVAKEMLSTVVTSGTGKAAAGGRRVHLGQDRHHRELRRRLVRRRQRRLLRGRSGSATPTAPADGVRARRRPVAGGTYPAEIFHDFMTAALAIKAERDLARDKPDDDEDDTATGVPAAPVTPSQIPPASSRRPPRKGQPSLRPG